MDNTKNTPSEGPIKTGEEWAAVVEDKKFAQYLIDNYKCCHFDGAEFEAIARGFYK